MLAVFGRLPPTCADGPMLVTLLLPCRWENGTEVPFRNTKGPFKPRTRRAYALTTLSGSGGKCGQSRVREGAAATHVCEMILKFEAEWMSETIELFAAMRAGDAGTVQALVARDATVAKRKSELGVSAILVCLYEWNLEMLEILLSAGPPLDIFEAAALGKTSRVEALLAEDAVLLNAYSADGFTPLHLACFYGHHDVVACLLERGADPRLRSRNERAGTPLHEAANTGQSDILLMLLAHGAGVNATDSCGWTALHFAASKGFVDIVETLLGVGAIHPHDEDGRTPRDLALENGQLETFRALEASIAHEEIPSVHPTRELRN